MAEQYPQVAGGQRITGSLLRAMMPQTARKTADTARQATTTSTADPHLQFELEANAVYVWWGWLKYSSSTVADINIDFSGPSGLLGEWAALGPGIVRVISATDVASPAFQVDTSSATGYLTRMETNDVTSARAFGGLGVSATLTLDMRGTLRTASTAGTWSLDWAQRGSDATDTTIYTDSWITLLRVA